MPSSHPTIVSWFAHLRSVRLMEKHLAPLSLKPVHALALYVLSLSDAPVPAELLCERLGLSRRLGLRVSIFLHDRKLALRTTKTDGEQILEFLELTDHGRMILTAAMKLDEGADREFTSGLAVQDANAAVRLLTAMADGVPGVESVTNVVTVPISEH